MRYNRVIIAKVALRVASEDEVFWVGKCQKQNEDCAKAVVELRELASAPATMLCMDPVSLIEAGDTNRVSQEIENHLVDCHRCAKIGQYIASMPFPASEQRHVSLSA